MIKVLYDQQRQTEMVQTLINHAVHLWDELAPETRAEADDFLGIVGYILLQMMLRFKDPAYVQEDEWRVLLITWAQENQNVLEYRNRNGEHVPYVEWPLRPEYLEEVLIGPGPYGMDEQAPREILAASGMVHVPITRSQIPFR